MFPEQEHKSIVLIWLLLEYYHKKLAYDTALVN